MELHQNNRVVFEPISHSYLLDGEVILSGLTGLMKKHNLGANYDGIPDAVLENAAKQGTAIHELIQHYDEGDAVPSEPLIDQYRDAIHKARLKHVASEYLVSDCEIVATSIDKVYDTGKPGLVDLADIKTTLEVHRRALEWQLGAGKFLFERQNPGIKVRKCFCIHIDKKTRQLKDIIPVEPVSEQEVLALLDAERNGLIYIDENDIVEASVAIPEKELAAYVSNATQIAELKKQIKEIELQMAQNDSRLLAYMDKHNLDKVAAPGGVFSRKAAYVQTRVDSDKLKKNYPSIYEKVKKEINVKSSLSFKAS